MTFEGQYEEAAVVSGDPLPIKPAIPAPGEYPLEALSPKLAAAATAIVDKVQLPLSIAASSVLAAASLAVQPYVNVEMPTGEVKPTSLMFVTVAESGERKSSCDGFALEAVREREEEMRETYTESNGDYLTEKLAYDAAKKKATTGNKSRAEFAAALKNCGQEPRKPAQPVLLVDEPTMAALQKLFAEAMPSLGLFSDEGGSLMGGHAMNNDNRVQTGAVLSKLWDGATIKRVRVGSGNEDVVSYLPGRRLAMHIMLQPGVARKLFGDPVLRDQGLLSRTLVCHPTSKKGERPWRDPNANSKLDIETFGSRIMSLLRGAWPMDPETRELRPKLMRLSDDARALWIRWHDAVEKDLGKGGNFEDISGFAAKLPEHALRIAAVMAYFQNKDAQMPISGEAMARGIKIAQFHALEAMRLYGGGNSDDDTENADAIIRWIRERKLDRVGVRLLQNRGPGRLTAPTLKRALAILVDNKHLSPIPGGADITFEGETKRYRDAYNVIPDDAE